LCVSYSDSSTSSWRCQARLPLFPLSIRNGAPRKQEHAICRSLPPLAPDAAPVPAPAAPVPAPALPRVCKQISAHVTGRFASQLSSPSALPRYLSPPICRQEGRQNEPDTDESPAMQAMLMCVCVCVCVRVSVCAHTPVHVHMREGEKRDVCSKVEGGLPPVAGAWPTS